MELIFEVKDAEEGGFWARALGQSIFTQAETWDELRQNVLEAVKVHFEPPKRPDKIEFCHVQQ
jgi:predicted RNase H-like HicB family nuclease